MKLAANKSDTEVAYKIAERAVTIGLSQDRVSTAMDIVATHMNGCPLRLEDLLAADQFNFVHDVGGIASHLDRKTGKLLDCFVPRFSA